MSTKVKKELLKATGLSEKKGEDGQALAKRLIRAVSELEDAAWGALSEEAQSWYNDAADALNAKKTLPTLDEAEAEEEEAPAPARRRAAPAPDPEPEDESEDEEEAEEEPAPKAKAKPAPAAKAKPAPAAEEKPKKTDEAPTPRKTGVTQLMRETICKNDRATKEEIAEILREGKIEFRDSTLDIMYSDTMKTIEALRELKKLK